MLRVNENMVLCLEFGSLMNGRFLPAANDCSGSEAVGRLEPISDQDTANFSEPNLKLNEIRQHGLTGAKPTSGQNQHRDICAREEVFPGES